MINNLKEYSKLALLGITLLVVTIFLAGCSGGGGY